MPIQFASDLHLEFPDNERFIRENPLLPRAPMLILAGDIVPFKHIAQKDWFFDQISADFEKVFWLPGNHEYYGSEIAARSCTFEEWVRPNVKLVNNFRFETKDEIVLLTSLWSRIQPNQEMAVRRSMSDFHAIKGEKGRLTVAEYNALHADSLSFLADNLNEKEAGKKIIVVTHHVPSFMNYPEEFKYSDINSGFATEMHDMIANSDIDAWIFGHHHRNVAPFQIGNCKMLTNQLGYLAYRENVDFDLGRVV